MNKLLVLYIFILICLSCQKTDPTSNIINNESEICLTIKHHENIVANTEVYLKINSEDFPGYSGMAYDSLISESNNGRVCIQNIAYGKYWAMAKGYDLDWGDDVQGSVYFDLNQFVGVVDTVLVVNEF